MKKRFADNLLLKGRNFICIQEVRVNAHAIGVGFTLLCMRVFDHLNNKFSIMSHAVFFIQIRIGAVWFIIVL